MRSSGQLQGLTVHLRAGESVAMKICVEASNEQVASAQGVPTVSCSVKLPTSNILFGLSF